MDNVYIDIAQVEIFKEKIINNNQEAIECLNEMKTTVNSITNSYECESSIAIIEQINNDLAGAIKCHNDMLNLKDFLGKVLENAKNE